VTQKADAAIVTVGTELVTGERLDTNTRDIALALRAAGYRVRAAVSLPDDEGAIASELARLVDLFPMVVVTGGLGPTHDDVTREAAARALGLPLERRPELEAALREARARHTQADAARQVLRQADVIHGATILPAVRGTAPGQVIDTPAGRLVLLPGPPRELAPMLRSVLLADAIASQPVRLRATELSESDAQVLVTRALERFRDVDFTVLASPGEVEVLLFDDGAGEVRLAEAGRSATLALGAHCYSCDGSSLAETIIRTAIARDARIGSAESCTGGMVAAALTAVPGASAVMMGGIVAYANGVKSDVLGVPHAVLDEHGAVSEQAAEFMVVGAAARLGLTHGVAVTGIAGPDGATPYKPVGLAWFAVFADGDVHAEARMFAGDRDTVRLRATATALDLLRHALEGG
jgi:nicotinamide-nucleotide amidase